MFLVAWLATVAVAAKTSQDPAQPQAAAAPAAPSPDAWPIPDGPGKDLFVRVCTKCHVFERVAIKRVDQAEWQSLINAMVVRGAEVNTEEEFFAIAGYLGEHLAPTVNVNTASAADLQLLFLFLGLPREQATAVVDYRTKNGPFKAIDDLKKVPTLDAARLPDIQGALTF